MEPTCAGAGNDTPALCCYASVVQCLQSYSAYSIILLSTQCIAYSGIVDTLLPGVPTACVAKTLPLLCASHRLRVQDTAAA